MKHLTVVIKKPEDAVAVMMVMEDSLDAMQAIVGGYIERVDGLASGVGEGIDMYLNEESKMLGHYQPNLWLFDKQDQVWGTCFFVGGDEETGESRSLTDAEVATAIKWCGENRV